MTTITSRHVRVVTCVLLLIRLASPLRAQDVDLQGRVLSAATLKPIAGAEVRAGDVSVKTDAAGRFTLIRLAGTVVVTVSADGFLPETLSVVRDPAVEIEVLLVERRLLNEEITISGATPPVSVAPSAIPVTPLEVRRIAGAGENVFRVLHTLPGVGAADEFGSRLTVRGGGPDQNLTVMDGVEIYNPYRLFGLTSAFNPETVESFDLMAGGFSAKYGDRLSSILVIQNRAGTRQAPLAASTGLALTDANIVAEGRLPNTTTGSWLVTGRRTYYDLVAERFLDADLPSFADLQANGVWEPKPGRVITVFGLVSREGADAEFDGEAAEERFGLQSTTRNDLVAISFFSSIGSRATSKSIVSWYRNREVLDVDADFRSESRRSNRPNGDAAAFVNILFGRQLGVRDIALRQELAVKAADAHVVEVGFESHMLRTDWAWRIAGDRNPHEANGSSAFVGASLPELLDSVRSTSRGGAWLVDQWRATSWIQAEPGVRFDWSGLGGELIASPRVAVTADIGVGLRLRAAGGLFTQSPGYEKLLQSDYFVDLSDAKALGLRSERAWHGVVGVERHLPAGVVARVEGYYKRFRDLLIGRLETDAEASARATNYDFPSALARSVPSAPQVTSVPANSGRGRAYGMDVYVGRQATAPSNRLTGWLSYTWGKAETTAYGRTFPFDYDRQHALGVVANYRVRRSLEVGTTVRVQSGFPYTPARSVRVAGAPDVRDLDGDDNLTEIVPQRDEQGMIVWEADFGGVENLNAGRMPLFARVDLRTTFKPGWSNNRWQFYIEVINLLNRRNASSLEPALEYDPGSDRPRIKAVREGGLPLIPSIGIRYVF